MLKDSRRLVFPLPLGPRIRLMPGSQVILSSGRVFAGEKFLKFRTTLKSILKAKTVLLSRRPAGYSPPENLRPEEFRHPVNLHHSPAEILRGIPVL